MSLPVGDLGDGIVLERPLGMQGSFVSVFRGMYRGRRARHYLLPAVSLAWKPLPPWIEPAIEALEHPLFARVITKGSIEAMGPYHGTAYISYEDDATELLGEWQKTARRPADHVELARALAVGLHAARTAGADDLALGRDMIGVRRGSPVVFGAGITKLVDALTEGLTQALPRDDVAIARIELKSPEAIKGLPGPRGDAWSVGALLFFLFSGRMPFEATRPMELVNKIFTEYPPHLRTVVPSTPLRVGEIVAACLSKVREDRFADTGELARALEQCLG